MSETTITSRQVDSFETNVYSSVPDKAFASHYGSKEELKRVLSEVPGKFFSSRRLAKLTGYSDKGTCVDLRKAITELIEEEREPIVSGPKGYAKAKGVNQLIFCRDALEQRRMGLDRRIEAYAVMIIKWRGEL